MELQTTIDDAGMVGAIALSLGTGAVTSPRTGLGRATKAILAAALLERVVVMSLSLGVDGAISALQDALDGQLMCERVVQGIRNGLVEANDETDTLHWAALVVPGAIRGLDIDPMSTAGGTDQAFISPIGHYIHQGAQAFKSLRERCLEMTTRIRDKHMKQIAVDIVSNAPRPVRRSVSGRPDPVLPASRLGYVALVHLYGLASELGLGIHRLVTYGPAAADHAVATVSGAGDSTPTALLVLILGRHLGPVAPEHAEASARHVADVSRLEGHDADVVLFKGSAAVLIHPYDYEPSVNVVGVSTDGTGRTFHKAVVAPSRDLHSRPPRGSTGYHPAATPAIIQRHLMSTYVANETRLCSRRHILPTIPIVHPLTPPCSQPHQTAPVDLGSWGVSSAGAVSHRVARDGEWGGPVARAAQSRIVWTDAMECAQEALVSVVGGCHPLPPAEVADSILGRARLLWGDGSPQVSRALGMKQGALEGSRV